MYQIDTKTKLYLNIVIISRVRLNLIELSFLLILTASCAKTQIIPEPHWNRPGRGPQLSLENVDFATLEEAAQRLNPDLAHNGFEELVRANFQFIFYNKLNTGSFLMTPPPQDIVDQIAEVLNRKHRLQELITEGKMLAARSDGGRRKRELVIEIRNAARNLETAFRRYFLDLRQSSYTVNMRFFETRDSQFGFYISLCDQINKNLSREVERYFLSTAPGVVEVSDYEVVGITVLSESIRKISMITEKNLRQ